jgi:hypothetical protein
MLSAVPKHSPMMIHTEYQKVLECWVVDLETDDVHPACMMFPASFHHNQTVSHSFWKSTVMFVVRQSGVPCK